MNIYINVEISSRELDSKLLLAILAAARGHQVIVGDTESFLKGVMHGVLAPGIFHTKSLTPAKQKTTLHKLLGEKGFKVTSNDEESAVEQDSFEWCAKNRFSEQTIDQAAAVFAWGPEDTNTLKKTYPKHSSKIHTTGSPRVDMWKPFFSDYWEVSKKAPLKPFLLISSNMSRTQSARSFFELYKLKKKLGYFDRDPEVLGREFAMAAESYLKTPSFIEAIKLLCKNNIGYDIVLRPHPNDSIEIWKTYLEDIPNLHIIREGSLSAWINNAFAVMQYGCTSAVEATINKTPVIQYNNFQKISYKVRAYKLGIQVNTLDDLLLEVNSLFKSIKIKDQKEVSENLPSIIHEKILLDKDELAAEKIIKVWESLDDNNISKFSNLKKYKLLLKFYKFRKLIGKLRKFFLPDKFKINDEVKFPYLKKDDVQTCFKKIQNILGIENVKCEVLSDRTILIKNQ